jgi:SpoVK/Ycf46/Vps4 family AAA+-type ATPase
MMFKELERVRFLSSTTLWNFVEKWTVLEDQLQEIQFTKQKAKLNWNDIAGLHHAKKILIEAIVLPRRFPSLFSGFHFIH